MRHITLIVCLILVFYTLSSAISLTSKIFSEYSSYGEILPASDLKLTNMEQHSADIKTFFTTYDQWLSSWKAQNVAQYMSYYHPDFRSDSSEMDFSGWQAHKNRVFTPRRPVKVEFSKSTFTISNSTIKMEAMQDYQAGRYKDYGKKTVVWTLSDGTWQINKEEWVAMEREVIEPPVIVEPPIVIIPPKPDTLRPIWEARTGQVPYEYINVLLNPQTNFGDHLFVVEKSDQYAGLFTISADRQQITLKKTYYISSGQNPGNKYKWRDLKTPEGMYFTLNFIPQRQLHSKFGSGAFVLDYPNEMDRLRKKTGSGIWIHGSDKDIEPKDTEGCIRFENKEINYFHEELNLDHAPIIISEKIEWTTISNLNTEIANINKFISDWKTAWQNLNITQYLSYYDTEEFGSDKQRMDYKKWADYKQNVFANANHPVVTFGDFSYHYADNLLLITCTQDYKSGSYADFGKKQLILKRVNNHWKIIQEEWVATS